MLLLLIALSVVMYAAHCSHNSDVPVPIPGEPYMHALQCSICGNIYGTENHYLTTGTMVNSYSHSGTCPCGTDITESHKVASWSWYSSELHHGTCTVCGYDKYASHTLQSYWSCTSTHHIKYCTACGGRLIYEEHIYNKVHICMVCGNEFSLVDSVSPDTEDE